jgi:hypothetical protein
MMVVMTGDPARSLHDVTGLGTTTDAVTDRLPTGAPTHTTIMIAKRLMEDPYDTVMITTAMSDMTDTKTSGSAPAAAADLLTVNRGNPRSIQMMNPIQAWSMPGLQRITEGACPLNSW